MARTRDRRADVRNVVPGARSVIVTATLYNTDRPYTDELPPDVARLSRYAWGDDYHDVIKSRLDGAAGLDAVRRATRPSTRARTWTPGPVQERVYAQYAGPRVDRQEHVPDQPGDRIVAVSRRDHLHAAARAGYAGARAVRQLHALPRGVSDRCAGRAGRAGFDSVPLLSDHRAAIVDSGRRIARRSVRHVYGCDICQEVCPYNQPAPRSDDAPWQPRAGLDLPRLVDLWRRPDAELRALVKGSAMTRAKLVGPQAQPRCRHWQQRRRPRRLPRCEDAGADRPSADDPMVREHVEWALEQASNRGDAVGQ